MTNTAVIMHRSAFYGYNDRNKRGYVFYWQKLNDEGTKIAYSKLGSYKVFKSVAAAIEFIEEQNPNARIITMTMNPYK